MSMPSIFHNPFLIANALRHPIVFLVGFREARDTNGMTYDGDPDSNRSRSYDTGRDLRLWGRA